MFSLVSELMNDILLHFHVPRYRSGFSLQSGLNAQGELAGEPVSALLNPSMQTLGEPGEQLPDAKSCRSWESPQESVYLAMVRPLILSRVNCFY